MFGNFLSYSKELIIVLPFESKYAASEKGTETIYQNFSDTLSDKLNDNFQVISGNRVVRMLEKLDLYGLEDLKDSELDLFISESKADYIIIGEVERESKMIRKYLTIKCIKTKNKSIVFEDTLKLKLTTDNTYKIVKNLILSLM